MKITVDSKNKVVIASEYHHSKKVTAISRCLEDVFDENFGVDMAKRNLDLKMVRVKARDHESYRSQLKAIIKWCEKEIENETKIIDGMDAKAKKMHDDNGKFIAEYFKV